VGIFGGGGGTKGPKTSRFALTFGFVFETCATGLVVATGLVLATGLSAGFAVGTGFCVSASTTGASANSRVNVVVETTIKIVALLIIFLNFMVAGRQVPVFSLNA